MVNQKNKGKQRAKRRTRTSKSVAIGKIAEEVHSLNEGEAAHLERVAQRKAEEERQLLGRQKLRSSAARHQAVESAAVASAARRQAVESAAAAVAPHLRYTIDKTTAAQRARAKARRQQYKLWKKWKAQRAENAICGHGAEGWGYWCRREQRYEVQKKSLCAKFSAAVDNNNGFQCFRLKLRYEENEEMWRVWRIYYRRFYPRGTSDRFNFREEKLKALIAANIEDEQQPLEPVIRRIWLAGKRTDEEYKVNRIIEYNAARRRASVRANEVSE